MEDTPRATVNPKYVYLTVSDWLYASVKNVARAEEAVENFKAIGTSLSIITMTKCLKFFMLRFSL